MSDTTISEETLFTRKGAVDELIDDYEGARRQFFLEGAARRHRHKVGHASALQDIDIGPVVDMTGRYPVAATVARQEYHRKAADLAAADLVGRLTPGAVNLLPAGVVHFDVVDTGPADNSEN